MSETFLPLFRSIGGSIVTHSSHHVHNVEHHNLLQSYNHRVRSLHNTNRTLSKSHHCKKMSLSLSSTSEHFIKQCISRPFFFSPNFLCICCNHCLFDLSINRRDCAIPSAVSVLPEHNFVSCVVVILLVHFKWLSYFKTWR